MPVGEAFFFYPVPDDFHLLNSVGSLVRYLFAQTITAGEFSADVPPATP
jgi:hypothetical protein